VTELVEVATVSAAIVGRRSRELVMHLEWCNPCDVDIQGSMILSMILSTLKRKMALDRHYIYVATVLPLLTDCRAVAHAPRSSSYSTVYLRPSTPRLVLLWG
jgi:hypothetical protein